MTRPAAVEQIESVLKPGAVLRPAEDGIWSAFETDPGAQQYDSIATVYDRVIGNRLYQRLMWGNEIARDTRLARDAANSASGWMLDAGCGSLLFTDAVHASSGRPTVLFDLSVEMLRRSRDRLIAQCGRVPEHVALVQGDVFALPFGADSFDTVLCPGILHLFEQPANLLESLGGVLSAGGGFYASALVTDRPFGARMLRMMRKRGEVPSPIDSAALASVVERVFGLGTELDVMGNMAHVRAARVR